MRTFVLKNVFCVLTPCSYISWPLLRRLVFIQYTPDKWNLQGTEENGFTEEMFNLPEVAIAPR